MARTPGQKPPDSPLPEKDRKELLDELSSVQDMLGNQDDAPEKAGEDPPLLQPETSGHEREARSGGDSEEQMPLLQPDTGDSGTDPANERLRQALSERPNPFLSDAARNTDPKNRTPSEASTGAQPDSRAEPSAPATATPTAGAHASGLNEQQMRALVDEILAAWLPKIERELRDKLMEHLRNQQG